MSHSVGTGPDTTPSAAAGFGLAALVAGAVAMGASPIFVRLAEVGPMTSAFWRVALALPALWLWSAIEGRRSGDAPARPGLIVLAGALFAGDLICWHLAIVGTSVANATFFATMTPVIVLIFSYTVFGERIRNNHLKGLALCLFGGAMLVGTSLKIAPERLTGDAFGLATAGFFASYILAVGRLRSAGLRTGRIVFLSTLVTAAILLPVALVTESQTFPETRQGLMALVALGLVSHVGGQGLLGYALGLLPASFSSLVIFLEGVAAAALGWLVLGEALTPMQGLGAAAIILGVLAARGRTRRGALP